MQQKTIFGRHYRGSVCPSLKRNKTLPPPPPPPPPPPTTTTTTTKTLTQQTISHKLTFTCLLEVALQLWAARFAGYHQATLLPGVFPGCGIAVACASLPGKQYQHTNQRSLLDLLLHGKKESPVIIIIWSYDNCQKCSENSEVCFTSSILLHVTPPPPRPCVQLLKSMVVAQ